MTLPTLQSLIEEQDDKKAVVRVVIGGVTLPKIISVSYQFDIGQVPTATITVPGLGNLPTSVQEEAAVQIWLGYQVGVTYLESLVFGGAVVDSVGNNGANITITCVQDGPRKLSYSYNRRIAFDFDAVTAVEACTALLDLAGVSVYYVDLDPWLIGTAVPYTAALGNQIQFSSYGDAINKIAEVDGSPWYALPSGQVRVEKRDPIPSPTARRTYFASILTGPIETQPSGIDNTAARPRIVDISKTKNRRDVANFIEVDGAVLVTLGPNGEQNSNQIIETVDGSSGQFPNGAYWIPTPPLFQDFNFSNELVDTDAKAFEVAERYYDLKNRLFEDLPITVPGDPDVFLGETVEVKDLTYSGTSSLYFVKGYTTTIDENSCQTTLNLTGGPEAGTTGFAAPFAEFYWIYNPLITPGGPANSPDLGPTAQPAAKLCEDLPKDTAPPDQTKDPTLPDTAMVYIGLDGTYSQDFDGYIVQWKWTWKDDANVTHTLYGPRQTLIIDPTLQGSINVTLEVTDNSGRTGSITKNINTNVNIATPAVTDPTLNDTNNGGGVGAGPCTEIPFPYDVYGSQTIPGQCEGLELAYYIAAKTVAMGSLDNRTWNDLDKTSAQVTGDFISVDAAVNNSAQEPSAIFGTSQGEVVKSTDQCATGKKVFEVPGDPEITCIHFDTSEMGSQGGGLPPPTTTPTDQGDIPIYTQSSPGTMTIVQAYKQCILAGFSHDTAIIAVAIMVRESGLYSKAVNTAGNSPPSTDRGIAQINDYYHPDVSDACAFNTQCAIEAMFRISSGGSDFSAWKVVGGTYLTGTNVSAVQEAVGSLSGSAAPTATVSTSQPDPLVVPSGLKVWLGTSDGRIYVSDDSGDTWDLWFDFGDGLPIKAIGTPPRYGAQTSSLWVFGGDTSNPNTLVRIDPAKDKNFVPLYISGDLLTAIQTAGAGFSCTSALNSSSSLILFSGGVSPLAWTNPDPLGTPDGWTPCTGLAGTIHSVAPGYSGEYVIAGTDSFKCTDDVAFTDEGTNPSTINHIIWRGLPGMYSAVGTSGFYNSVDYGNTFGPMRPNTTFGTTWPVGAVGEQLAISLGARSCIPVTPGECDQAPRYEAAVGVELVSAKYMTNGQKFSDSILGISSDVPDTSLVTTYYEGSAHHKSLGHAGSQGTSLNILIKPTITDSFLFLAVASRPGDAPSSVTDTQGLTWDLIKTVLSSDSVGAIRLSIYRTNANADSILGLRVTVAFGSSQSVILAIADEWIGLTATVGTDPTAASDTEYNSNVLPSHYPDDYLLSYTFNNPYAFEEAVPAPVSFGIALQLESCITSGVMYLLACDSADITHQYLLKWDGSAWALIAGGINLLPLTGGISGIDSTPSGGEGALLGSSLWASGSGLTDTDAWRSDDTGATWALKLSWATSTDNPHASPITISHDGATVWAARRTGGIFEIVKSTDNGDSWSNSLTGADANDNMYHAAAHPTDSNIIAFAGSSGTGVTFKATIWVTANGGTSWSTVTLDRSEGPFSDSTCLFFTDTGELIYTTLTYDGVSTDRLSAYHGSSPYASFSRVDLLTSNPDIIYDGPFAAINQNPQFIGVNWDADTPDGFFHGRVFRATDAATWTELAEPFSAGNNLFGLAYVGTTLFALGADVAAGGGPGNLLLAKADNADSGSPSWSDITSSVNTIAGVTLAVLAASMIWST